jgi:hypothetical protein
MQSEVAKLLGRTQGFISREDGSHRVTVIELFEFGNALGFDRQRSPE